jgi:hypothetical protein
VIPSPRFISALSCLCISLALSVPLSCSLSLAKLTHTVTLLHYSISPLPPSLCVSLARLLSIPYSYSRALAYLVHSLLSITPLPFSAALPTAISCAPKVATRASTQWKHSTSTRSFTTFSTWQRKREGSLLHVTRDGQSLRLKAAAQMFKH